MAPSIQTDEGSTYSKFTRFHLAGNVDPNHIDNIGPIWLLSHLSLPAFGAPGQLDLNDAQINVTIRAHDLQANGTQLAFWIIRYIPETDVTENYYVGLQSTNWAYTGGNFIDQLGEEWVTISVDITDDMTGWTYAGNYQTDQGDWADRYVEYPLEQTIGNVDATLHLVFIGDDSGNPPSGFVDIANIEIVTQVEAVPLNNFSYQVVLHAIEDQPYHGTLAIPDGVDPLTASFSIVSGSVKQGEISIDAVTGAFTFTPFADFWGPNRDGVAAEFQYVVTDASGSSAPLGVYVYVAPVNDTPSVYAGSENLTTDHGAELNYTLRLGSDIDLGDTMIFEVDQATIVGGTITLDEESGRYTFTPDSGFSGIAQFAYRVSDGLSASAYKTIEINVLPEGQSQGLPSFDQVVTDYLIPGDYQSFVFWTIRLAEAGDDSAAYHYGTWMRYGLNVQQSVADAIPYLERALGLAPEVSLLLAELYISGTGVTKDPAHGRQLLLDLGDHPTALYELGILSELGLGTPEDASAAVTYYIQAAKLGNADAMYTLGRRYLAGEGAEYQPEDAYFMLGLSLRLGGGPSFAVFDDLLRFNMDKAALHLTPDRLAELDAAIANWSIGFAVPVNDAPVADLADEAGNTLLNQDIGGLLLPGTDRDGDALRFLLVAGSQVNGTVTIDARTGEYMFVADQNFVGQAYFQYILSDGQMASDAKLVTITIAPITAGIEDTIVAGETQTLLVASEDGLLSNDYKIAGAASIAIIAVNGASVNVGQAIETPYGSLTINMDGSYSFIASAAFLIEGEQVVVRASYTIADDLGNMSVAELVITTLGQDGTVISGSGTLVGTGFADVLNGSGGDDTLRGYAGADILDGGAGSDTAAYDDAPAAIFVNLAAGTAKDNGYGTVDILRNVENVVGSAFNDVLVGNADNNLLSGGGGSDVIAGGGGEDILVGGDGAPNQLIGGAGNDRYIITATGDSIVEVAGEGFDGVTTTLAQFTLPNNVESLRYVGNGNFRGFGNAQDNIIIGGDGDDALAGLGGSDELYGGAGNDVLEGGSGAPNLMVGGSGDDIYYASAVGDTIIEGASEGYDRVYLSSASFVLPSNVELLAYTGNGDFTGTGNALNNLIFGGAGNDILDGAGGSDILVGGAGNDRLIGGSQALSEMLGGAGNDIYVLSGAGNSIVELAGEGVDSVHIDHSSLALPANVENLLYFGTGNFTGVGNAGNNMLISQGGDDFLSGLAGDDILDAGAGANILLGGTEADQFRISSTAGGIDRILDFVSGEDKLQLAGNLFGTPSSFTYVAGTTATGTSAAFLYDPVSGVVRYDPDGAGGQEAVAVAQFGSGLNLTASDFGFF